MIIDIVYIWGNFMDYKLSANIFAAWFGISIMFIFSIVFCWVFDLSIGISILTNLGQYLYGKFILRVFILGFIIDLVGQPIYRREYEIKEWFRKQFIK